MKSQSFYVVSWVAWVLFGVFSNTVLHQKAITPKVYEITVLLDPTIEDPQTWTNFLDYLPGSLVYKVLDKEQIYQRIQQIDPKLAESVQLVGPEILPTEVHIRVLRPWVLREALWWDSLLLRFPGVLRIQHSSFPTASSKQSPEIPFVVYSLLLLGLAILGEVEGIAPLRPAPRFLVGLVLGVTVSIGLILIQFVFGEAWWISGYPWMIGLTVFVLAIITPIERLEGPENAPVLPFPPAGS